MKREIAIRSFILLGLSISLFLARGYTSEEMLACGEGSGCDVVRASEFANFFGISTPIFGVLFFGIALLLTLFAKKRKLLKVLFAGGTLAALALIAVQFFILEAICLYCMIVDISTLCTAALLFTSKENFFAPRLFLPVTLIATLIAIAIPFLWQESASQEQNPSSSFSTPLDKVQIPGVVTIVEFLDLSCEACQKEDAALRSLSQKYNDKVRIIRKLLPFGEHERVYAKALCCSSELGFGDQMAEILLSSPLPEPGAIESLVASFSVDSIAYRDCIDSWSEELLARDAEDASLLGVNILPSVWLNTERIDGHCTKEELEQLLLQELANL